MCLAVEQRPSLAMCFHLPARWCGALCSPGYYRNLKTQHFFLFDVYVDPLHHSRALCWRCCVVVLQVWLCGGSMEVLPCSRVAHIERKKKPYNNNIGFYTKRNALRVAEVWMDDYKWHVYIAWNLPLEVWPVQPILSLRFIGLKTWIIEHLVPLGEAEPGISWVASPAMEVSRAPSALMEMLQNLQTLEEFLLFTSAFLFSFLKIKPVL